MSDPFSPSCRHDAVTELACPLPAVRLELRHGSGRASSYSLSDAAFVIGTVPGCDLRVPGAGLPPILGLISRHPGGVSFRKLAPTQAILLNGQTAGHAEIRDGDRLTIGALDIVFAIERVEHVERETAKPAHATASAPDLLQAREELEEQLAQFRKDVERFQEERAAFEHERHKAQAARATPPAADAGLAVLRQDLEEREEALAGRVAEVSRQEQAVAAQTAEVEKQKQELAGMRQELADIRRQLYERYQERRDRLAGLQEAVNRAAQKVQERKRQLDADTQQLAVQRRGDAERAAELDGRLAQLAEAANELEQQKQLVKEHQEALAQDLAGKVADLEDREESLAAAKLDLDKRQQQHQADLVRLNRLQAELEERAQALDRKSQEIERRFAQMERDSSEMEEQVREIEELRGAAADEREEIERRKAEHDALAAELAQRAAALEGQQATFAALRTRLERMREEVRREEQRLAEERCRQEQTGAELQQQLQETLRIRADLEAEQKLHAQDREQIAERSAVLEAAVNQLRQSQESLAQREDELRQRAADLDRQAAEQVEQTSALQTRVANIDEAQRRLEADRAAVLERMQALSQAEQVRERLQDQLRRRADELGVRQRELAEQVRHVETQAAELDKRRTEMDRQQLQSQQQLASRHQELQTATADLAKRQTDLLRRQEGFDQHFQKVQEAGRQVAAQRKALAEERAQLAAQLTRIAEQQKEFDGLRREAAQLVQQLPELELRAGTALERLTGVREQVRDHLNELHAYVQQCQEDLEGLHAQLQGEAERLNQREQAVRRAQDQHRLAVASFRQQLIDWQAQVADKKRLLNKDETLLERKQAKVQERVREIDATSQRLAQQAEQLQEKERAVLDRRQEVDRHLVDMREWYRKKLRELAGIDGDPKRSPERAGAAAGTSATPATLHAVRPDETEVGDTDLIDGEEEALTPTGGNILSLTGPADEADQRLGDLLRSLELVDADTLGALLTEARRQRRSLRQILLAGGVVTLYQMALIEAGNVAGLMLGPVRVLDRLRATPRETVYRVFDPRRGTEAVLRLLTESEAEDAVNPDEFRQRFAQAQIDHPHLARTLEVLDIGGRPAVLQEWLVGLPCPEWPPLASVPGVCFRLLGQAALGLATIHQAGLVHGHLSENLLFLTGEGVLKLSGFGEPPWLAVPAYSESAGAADDLAALGKIAARWSIVGVRKGSKTKPLPPALLSVIDRLNSATEPYASARDLLEDLDRISAEVPANAEAWDRLIKFVRDHAMPELLLRQSA